MRSITKFMEVLGIKRIMLSSNAQAAPSNFVAVMKMVIGILAIAVTIFTLYLSLRRCSGVAANNRHPMQQAGMNASTFIMYNVQEHNLEHCACLCITASCTWFLLYARWLLQSQNYGSRICHMWASNHLIWQLKLLMTMVAHLILCRNAPNWDRYVLIH